MSHIQNILKKTTAFVLKSYNPWMLWVTGVFSLFVLVTAGYSILALQSTIEDQIESKQSEIKSAEQKIELTYQARATANAEFYYECMDGRVTEEVDVNCLSQDRPLFKSKPYELISELNSLIIISTKSWGKLFFEEVFIRENSYDPLPLIYYPLLFMVALPLFRFSIHVAKVLITHSRTVIKEMQTMQSFQKYFLVLLLFLLVVVVLTLVIK